MKQAFSPLDEELGLLPNTAYTPHLQAGLGRLGTALPFRQAQAHFQFFTGVAVSEASLRRLTQRAGLAAVTVEASQVAALLKDPLPAPPGPEVGYLSGDGCFVPVVGGDWKEVKTLVIGKVERPSAEAAEVVVHTSQLTYFSRCLPIEEFKPASLAEVQRRGLENAKTVCAPSDGAVCLQALFDYHRADAVRILDFPHASEYLAKAGQAVLGVESVAFKRWFEEQCHLMKHSNGTEIISALQHLQNQAGLAHQDEAIKVVQTSLEYLMARQPMLRYAHFRALGYPIGSGATESANKLVVEERLKGPGMHWAIASLNPLLALRNLSANERWECGWGEIEAQWLSQKQAKRAERGTLRQLSKKDCAKIVGEIKVDSTLIKAAPTPSAKAVASLEAEAAIGLSVAGPKRSVEARVRPSLEENAHRSC